ncbi:MAG: hypothetical protein ACRD4H_11390 [Candidatus Acidiferrales bacterium]
MRRASLLVFGLLLIPTTCFGQSTSTDSQTLQALLKEVRQLRQDVRTVTVASERVQILLSRLQAQQTAVGRAQQRLSDAHSSLAQAQKHRIAIESEVKYYTGEDTEERTPNATQRQRIEDSLPHMKSDLEQATMEEQKAQTNDMEAKNELQAEQAKLDDLQDELDRLDRSLESFARQPIN